MVAGVFDELAARAAAAPVHDRDQRRRLRHEPRLRRGARHRAAGDGARGLLRPGLGRDGRREQEHDQDPRARRACTRRATSSTTRRSPARRRSRTCASGRSRSARRTSCSRRASSAATSSGCSTASTCSAGRRTARRCCSTARTRRTRSGTRCRARCRSRSSPSTSTLYVIDAGRIAREAGLAGRTNTVLQTCFFAISGRAAARAGDRADQGGDRQDLRPARRRGGRAQPGGGRPRARRPAPGRACPSG